MDNLTPYNPNRLLSFYREIGDLHDGRIPRPRMAIVYPSYVCNQDCEYCFYQPEREDHRGVMFDRDQFMHVIYVLNELGVRGIEYCGGGEPFMNPHIEDATRLGLAKGIKFGALTNGTLLTPIIMDMMVNHFSYVRISVDTFNLLRYLSKRGATVDQYNKMIDSLIFLSNSPKNGLKVGVKMLVTPDDEGAIFEDVEEAIKLCAGWSIDSLQIRVDEHRDGQISEVFGMSEQLKALVDRRRQTHDFHIGVKVERSSICERCWLSPLQVMIDPRGDVYLCCYYQHRKDRHRLCNIFDDDLISIWGSDTHRDKIEQIQIEECNVFSCRFHNYHRIANAVVDGRFQLEFC